MYVPSRVLFVSGTWERLFEEKSQLELLLDCCEPPPYENRVSWFIDDLDSLRGGQGVGDYGPPKSRLKVLTEDLLVEALEQVMSMSGSPKRPRLKAT